ncbi:hypothetical protein ACT3CD_09220 [Geofilum sp. OHC36d9]|uniref:hypothetical protein n=1 Tax=Geofilum sp. OHC36d9 TaxID=3458413 RepID=UPI004033F247
MGNQKRGWTIIIKNTIANRYYYETGISVSHRLFSFPFTMYHDQLCTLQNNGTSAYSGIMSKKIPLYRVK